MARLRVPASPVRDRQVATAYASACNQSNNCPFYNSQSDGYLDMTPEAQATDTSLSPRTSIQSPIKGTVKSLTSMSRATKRGIQGYNVVQYKTVKKVSHKHMDRTGTKAAFSLGQQGEEEEEETELLDEDKKADLDTCIKEKEQQDRPWNGVQDFKRKNATLKTGVVAKIKASSLAQCIASASADDTDYDLESDLEDEEIDLSQKTKECEVVQEDIPPTAPTDNYAFKHSHLLSPLEAIDAPYPWKPKQDSRLRRHSGSRSLAFLIAHVGDVSSYPDDDDRSPSCSLSVPPSPSSLLFPSPNAGNRGLSADNALEMLRERFRKIQYAGGGTGGYCREWLDAKFEMGCSTVHGPSLLRFATNCHEHEELQPINNSNVITHLDQHEAISGVRTSTSKDTLNTKSSVQTSVFSRRTSISSCQTHFSPSAYIEHYPSMDTLGIDIDKHECDTEQDPKHIGSLPILTTKERFCKLRVKYIEKPPCVPLQASAEDLGGTLLMVMVNEAYECQLVRYQTVEFYDDVPTDPDGDSQLEPACFDIPRRLRRKSTSESISKTNYSIQKLSKKTRQVTHGCVKATKQLSRTAWTFVPATFSSQQLLQKINSITQVVGQGTH